jgi:hypothetical protein
MARLLTAPAETAPAPAGSGAAAGAQGATQQPASEGATQQAASSSGQHESMAQHRAQYFTLLWALPTEVLAEITAQGEGKQAGQNMPLGRGACVCVCFLMLWALPTDVLAEIAHLVRRVRRAGRRHSPRVCVERSLEPLFLHSSRVLSLPGTNLPPCLCLAVATATILSIGSGVF